MTNVKEVIGEIEELRDKFDFIKRNRNTIMLHVLRGLRCCECGHISRIKEVQKQMLWFRRMTRFYKMVLSILTLVLMFIMYGLWLSRHYNQASIYGGCSNSYFWPIDDCPIAF